MYKKGPEEKFLHEYDATKFDRPSATIDVVIFSFFDNELHVLIIKRKDHPYKNQWSLIGGYVDIHKDKNLEATAKRKLFEKTGVKTPYLEQVETIGNSKRDPRGWTITTVYFALISNQNIQLNSEKEIIDIKWLKICNGTTKEKLSFDHNEILNSCIERLKNKLLYTSLPIYLMKSDFTIGELQKVYEIILNNKIDHKSFRRRMLSVDILEETGEMRSDGKRPAKLYRLKEEKKTHFFTRNFEG